VAISAGSRWFAFLSIIHAATIICAAALTGYAASDIMVNTSKQHAKSGHGTKNVSHECKMQGVERENSTNIKVNHRMGENGQWRSLSGGRR
jgi:hypothetical protein